ncbi:MAG: type II secretion system F family protein [Candidatus Dormibacteraeota bacterium]|uniref:Type II secretion system F family protein n=1 Tax=Candidatus Aeolococcus gillhamiae TaxID=3127015 RepID=A0A934JT13_9BACT|nr:type II secretion system F family protein [Candidatus Dormibacteraeota bacterium]
MTLTLPAIAAAVLAAGTVMSLTVWAAGRRVTEADRVAARLSQYGRPAEVAAPRVRTGNPIRDLIEVVSTAIAPLLARSSHTGKLADDLQKADLKLKSSEWVLAVAGAGVALGVLLALRFGTPVMLLVGPVAAWLLSGVFLKFRQGRRTRAFNNQLGDTITLLSNALKAGYSFAQALASVAQNASPPISEEFGRAVREIALGINVDDALHHMVQRNKSEDFDLLVTAVQIQRVVGGNLAEVLDTIAYTIRERVRIQGEIRTLTAQARVSGIIITLLPFGLAGVLEMLSPSYFGPMLTETLGHILLGIGIFSIAIGAAAIQKIVKIEV